MTLPTITGDGNIAANGSSLTVSKRFSGLIKFDKPGKEETGSQQFTSAKPFMLGNMAVLDLNGNTDIYTQHKNMQFSTLTNVIDISERTLNIGTQVVAWNASGKPATTFVWDETTAKSGVKLVVNDTGIFYGQVVVDAEWTNDAGDDDITNPDNWTCTDSYGEEIEGGIPSTISNITIPDGEAITYPMGARKGSFTLGSGATLTIDLGEEGRYIEGTALMTSSAGTFSIDSDATVTTTKGGSVELTSDNKALLYAPAKTVVARWDFNDYNAKAPLSTNVLKATTGEAGFPCHYKGAGSTNITDGTIGGMSVTNVGLTAGNYAIVIPKYYHVKLPLPKTLQHSDWTIRMRFYTPAASDGTMRTFFTRDNTTDGDLFINKSNKPGGGGRIAPSQTYFDPVIAKDAWHLLTVSQRNGFGAFVVDGEQSYTWTDNVKWSFFTDKDYLYLSADNNGEDGLLYIDYIELAVETPAHDSTAIVDGVLTSDVVLTNDQDWTSILITDMNSKTIDLAGHTLTIAETTGTGKVYDSTADAENPGLLIVNVAEGETYKNEGLYIMGDMRLVKEGAGTYIGAVKSQTYTGGTVVNAGTAKSYGDESNYYYGANNSTFTVNAGGTLELNGKYYWYVHPLILNGGTISNTGAHQTAYTRDALGNITLQADSTLKMGLHVVFNRSGAIVDLGGHKLTVEFIPGLGDGKAQLTANQVTIKNGSLECGNNIVLYVYSSNFKTEDLTFVNNGDLRFATDLTVLNFTDNSQGANQTCGKTMSVTGRYTPKSTYLLNTKLMNGATLNLTEQTGPWTFQNTKTAQTLSYEEDATITVDLTGRTLDDHEQIVAWTTEPDATFVARGANVRLVRKSDGLYAERNFMIFVAYGTAGDFSYVAPETFTNAQWAGGQTNRVIEVVDAVESNAALCVDFVFSVSNLYNWADVTLDATGALIPAALGDGNGFYAWGDGAWHALPCSDVATDKTLTCRIEQKKIGEAWYVRYLVKGEGEQWDVLYSRTGRAWFETTQVAKATQAGMTADETLASIVATFSPAVQPSATFYWIGSTEGAWSDTNNWSLVQARAVATRAPGKAGDLAQVVGDVRRTMLSLRRATRLRRRRTTTSTGTGLWRRMTATRRCRA